MGHLIYADLEHNIDEEVAYRPALLNGRHIVDVVRLVCGPADVSEAELDRIRRMATQRARAIEPWGKQGVWMTEWLSAPVTVWD